jgi:hypothetical protein
MLHHRAFGISIETLRAKHCAATVKIAHRGDVAASW